MTGSARRLTSARLGQPATALTPREHRLLGELATMHAATTDQLARILFPAQTASERLARRHLRRLADVGLVRRFVDRSRDRKVGAPGHVHALTAAGLRLTSSQHAPGLRQRRAWRPSAAFLAHQLAISELYTRLVQEQAAGGPGVAEFLAEPDCWRRYGSPAGSHLVLRPDALVRLDIGDHENSWFIEIDRGTETRPTTIAAKCQAYHRYEASGHEQRQYGVFPGVAFIVPDERRANWMRRLIARQSASQRALFIVAREDQALETLAELEVTP
jgi:hypothetical protein